MTPKEEKTIDNAIKKTGLIGTTIGIIVAALSALGVSYSFYYNTTSMLENHETEIIVIKQDIKVLSKKHADDDVFKGTYKVEIQSMNEKFDRMEDKQDMMLKLMSEYIINQKLK